jgi:hypothetical protein
MLTYILLLLISADPYPTFQMVAEFPDKPACLKFVSELDAKPEVKELLVCQGMISADVPGAKEEKETLPAVPKKTSKKKEKCVDFNGMTCKLTRDFDDV